MIFFTSDHHFAHGNIISYCGRPFEDVGDMNAAMVVAWNSRVKPEDTVYHLGDFAWRDPAQWLSRLNGTKILIRGNHDRYTITKALVHGWARAYQRLEIPHGAGRIVLVHDPDEVKTVADGTVAIFCGHIHEKWSERIHETGRVAMNVGVDVRGYVPMTAEEILGGDRA